MGKIPGTLSDVISPYLTPYKYNKPLISGSGVNGDFDSLAADCPFVFYHQNRFFMLYIGFDGTGYQTGLAASDDLIHWEKKGCILKREDHVGWDKVGAAGTWILKETNQINELPRLKKVNNKYWMVYHSYPDAGYENGPAQIGLAWTEDENLMEWNRLPEPVYSYREGPQWEKGGLYKACLIENDNKYYMFYNAKNETYSSWHEQIGFIFSYDMLHWARYEGNPVIKVSPGRWDSSFCSDPCVLQDGNRWVMFYFGFDGGHAREGIAFSENLFNWVKYEDPIITEGNDGALDETHAHKPSVLKHNGILYHFYCACKPYKPGDSAENFGNEFRCLTVATSEPIERA